MIGLGLDGYDPDSQHDAAVAFRIRVVAEEQYIPRHHHRKGQLILALGGAIYGLFVQLPAGLSDEVGDRLPSGVRASPATRLPTVVCLFSRL